MRCVPFLLRPAVVAATLATFAACAAETPDVSSESATAVASLPALPAMDTLPWRLERPASWDDRVQEVDDPEGPQRLAEQGIHSARIFEYVPRDSSIVPQHLLGIYVYAEEAWAKLAEEDGPPQGDVLERRAGLVYVAGLPQSNPFAPGSVDYDEFQQRELTLDAVRAGFRVVR